MLLLLLGCTEAPAPAPPAPTLPGLSAAAPLPSGELTQDPPLSPTLSLTTPEGVTGILETDGDLHRWQPPAAPVAWQTDAAVVDLTLSRGRLLGLTETGRLFGEGVDITTGGSGEGLLVGDVDSGLVALLQGGLRVVEIASGEVLWESEASALSAITIGGGRVYCFDATRLQITVLDARSGEPLTERTVRPPHRSRAKGGKARQSIEITPSARATPPGAPRTLDELRGALHYDPTTDRLFFRQLVLDGGTLEALGHIQGIDGVLYADQGRVIGHKQGWDGTVSVMGIDPTELTATGRVPLLRPEGEPHIFYDPGTDSLTVSEPGRGRLLRWTAPLASP